jgi:hypothetical protein
MRLLVTASAVAIVLVGQQIPLPGVEPPRWGRPWSHPAGAETTASLSVLALGVAPLMSGTVLVELAALVIPAWRPLRISGPEGRARLARWSLVVTLGLALVQGSWLARALETYLQVTEGGAGFEWLTALTLSAGTFVLVALAALVARRGLGNGFSVVILASTLPSLAKLGQIWVNPTLSARGRLLAPGVLALTAAATVLVVVPGALARRLRRGPSLRLPSSGAVPLSLAASLLALSQVLPIDLDALGVKALAPGTPLYTVAQAFLLAGGTAALSWLFNQPARVARVTGLAPALVRRLGSAAWVHSLLFLLFVALAFTVGNVHAHVSLPSTLSWLAVCAIATDLAGEWRARHQHGDLVPVWPIHRVYAVDPALEALARAGIPALARGVGHRVLLQFVGPYIAIDVLVPPAHAAEAQRILRERDLG